ncbi:MAG: DUF4190 domain-containing protein [Curtobacterium sp.]
MSDQNQWPKPGEQQPDGQQPASQDPTASAPAPGSAAEPNGYGQDTQQPNPYAPQQPQYGAPQQQQQQYGAPQQNPYGAPQQPQYGAPQQQNPYAAPQQPQYGAPQNPYAASAPGSAPYAGQGAPGSAPYANPYAPAGAYSNAGYQPYAQRPKTNILAILSIVFGLGAIPFFFIAILLGPAGAILGHVALGKIKQNGEQGRGLALTGIIAGWVMTGVWILWIVVVVFAIGHSGGGYYDDNYDYGSTGAFIS